MRQGKEGDKFPWVAKHCSSLSLSLPIILSLYLYTNRSLSLPLFFSPNAKVNKCECVCAHLIKFKTLKVIIFLNN